MKPERGWRQVADFMVGWLVGRLGRACPASPKLTRPARGRGGAEGAGCESRRGL